MASGSQNASERAFAGSWTTEPTEAPCCPTSETYQKGMWKILKSETNLPENVSLSIIEGIKTEKTVQIGGKSVRQWRAAEVEKGRRSKRTVQSTR